MHCREKHQASPEDVEEIKRTFHLGDNTLPVIHQLDAVALSQKVGEGTELGTNETTITTLWKASIKGCDECNHTGYKGRIGIYEVLGNSLAIQKLIISNATSNQIQMQAISEGMITMQTDGLIKALRGQSTIEEVLRVTKE
jgi:type II secretory ATPase GspE/PulE/Tfp pilus assembly ATPase PilB-like protein